MLTKEYFDRWMAERKIAIIDGGQSTELEARGHDLNHPLWSAKSLKEDPNSFRYVHRDYFEAGADIVMTASYQATPQGLKEHFGMTEEESYSLIRGCVSLAQSAREDVYHQGAERNHKPLIAGSIGPYGAYLADGSEYRGDYTRTVEEFRIFHKPRIQALLDGGVDLLAFETIPNLIEIKAIVAMLKDDFPQAIAWLSCTVRDAEHLSDGSSWNAVAEAVRQCEGQIVAIGVNCVPMSIVTDTLSCISRCTDIPLLCYPNSGEIWNAETKTWHGVRPDDILRQQSQANAGTYNFQDHVPVSDWIAAGAKLIGGCCRTGPAFIQALQGFVYHSHLR